MKGTKVQRQGFRREKIKALRAKVDSILSNGSQSSKSLNIGFISVDSGFGVPGLKALLNTKHKIKFIVTDEEEVELIQFAMKHNIKVYDYGELSYTQIAKIFRQEKIDLGICLIWYLEKIPQVLLKAPKINFLNVHPSLLPRLHGANPITGAYLFNEKQTGVTVHVMSEKIDEGMIALQSDQVKVPKKGTGVELIETLIPVAAETLTQAVEKVADGTVVYRRQKGKRVSQCAMKDLRPFQVIDWRSRSENIRRRIDAFNLGFDMYYAQTYVGKNEFWVLKTEVIKNSKKYKNKNHVQSGQNIAYY